MRKDYIRWLLLLCCWPGLLQAKSYISCDIPVGVNDHSFNERSIFLAGPPVSISVADLVPAGVEISAFGRSGNIIVFTVDHPVDLGGHSFSELELIAYDVASAKYSSYLDLSSLLPASARIDALSLIGTNRFVFSTDIPVSIAGKAYSESDLIVYDSGTTSLYLAGSIIGIANGVNLDAISLIGNDLYFSVDIPTSISGMTIQEADIIVKKRNTLSLVYSATAAGVALGTDLTAVEFQSPMALPYLLLLLDQ